MGDADVKKRSGFRGLLRPERLLTDDRGVEHRFTLSSAKARVDARSRYALEQAERLIISPPRFGVVFVAAMLVAVPTLALILILARSLGVAFPGRYGFVAIFAMVMLAMALAVRTQAVRRLRTHGEEYASILLSNGLCPVCAYEITASPELPDGLVVCAECGAAWKHERVSRQTIPAEAPDEAEVWRRKLFGRSIFWNNRRIRDGENRERRLLDAEYHRAVELARNPDHRQRLTDARRILRRSSLVRRVLAGVIAAVLLYTQVQANMSRVPSPGAGFSAKLVLDLVMLVFFMLWVVWMALSFFNPRGHSANKDKAIDAMLRRRLCPSCGGDMIDEPVSDRLLSRCPRCLAVWKMPFLLETLRHRERPTPAAPASPGRDEATGKETDHA